MKQETKKIHSLIRKMILTLIGLVVILFGISIFLFSPIGNTYIRDFLLSKLESQTHFQWQARHFKLTPSQIALEAVAHNGQLELFLESEYSLFLRNFKGSFLLNSKGLSTTIFGNKTLNFSDNSWIEGEFGGEFSHYTLQAQSNLLDSQSDFHAYGSYWDLQGLNLHTKNASLNALFTLLGQSSYGDGILNFDLKLDKMQDSLNANPYSLWNSLFNTKSETMNLYNGNLNISLEGGELEAQEFLAHFGLTIPPTHFMGELYGEIHHNAFEHYLKIYSNIGDFELKGASNLATLATNTEFHFNLQNLSPLSPFFGIPLNGALSAKGIAKGDTKNMLLNGTMQLENSPLDFHLNLQNLKANTLKITSQNLEASALFNLLNQPAFLRGILSLDLDLRDFTQGISGIASMQSQDLFINSPLIEMHTQIGFPATTFQLDSKMELAQGKGILNYTLTSNLADFKSQGGTISLQPFTFEIPQNITLKKLQNFSYRNKSLLKGTLNAQGIATNESLNLKGTINKETPPNTTQATNSNPEKTLDKNQNLNDSLSLMLNKQEFNLSLHQLNSAQIYTIFPKIPHYFEGIANLTFKENFANKVRQINFDITSLKFRDGAFLRSLNQATQQNLASSIFNGFIYHQLFPDETLHSTISLQSKENSKSTNLQIQSPKIVTNLNNLTLNGNLRFKHSKGTKNHRLYGNIYQPKIQ